MRMKTKMAENHKGGILNKTEKFLRRRKTKVLQSLGKQEKTTDEFLIESCQKLDRQQEIANKFQKDLRSYIHHAKALSAASKTFYTTVGEAYEAEWDGHAQVEQILTCMDNLWQDYLQKLHDQVQEPLAKYLSHIPQIKARVSKRGRKLIDYDNAKYTFEAQQNAKKKDDAKIQKAQEDMEQAKKIYEDLNQELHVELPEFYDSRVKFYGNLFESLFSAENVFQSEAGKGSAEITVNATQLANKHCEQTYTPRKNRNTIIVGDDGWGTLKRDNQTIPFFFRYSLFRSDENLVNGHASDTNGGSSAPDSPQPDSPSPSSSPVSPTSTAGPVGDAPSAPLTNGDTSKDHVEDDDYENTAFPEGSQTGGGAKVTEVSEEPSADTTTTTRVADDTETQTKLDTEADSKADVVSTEVSSTEEQKPGDDGVTITVEPVHTEVKVETEKLPPADDSNDNEKVDEPVVNGEVLVSAPVPAPVSTPVSPGTGDDKQDDEQGAPADAPPPIPSTPPPGDDGEDEGKGKKDNTPTADSVYEVPPPAKPIDNDLPDNYQYTVVATHAYKGEDDDELSFDAQEVIYVVLYDDPEEQDPGWQMGIRKIDGQKGVFPENFTKKV